MPCSATMSRSCSRSNDESCKRSASSPSLASATGSSTAGDRRCTDRRDVTRRGGCDDAGSKISPSLLANCGFSLTRPAREGYPDRTPARPRRSGTCSTPRAATAWNSTPTPPTRRSHGSHRIKRRVTAVGARRGQLPHLPGHGHHGVSAQWRHARAQAIAAHESPRTTKLYDRTADEVTVEDIEKIGI